MLSGKILTKKTRGLKRLHPGIPYQRAIKQTGFLTIFIQRFFGVRKSCISIISFQFYFNLYLLGEDDMEIKNNDELLFALPWLLWLMNK